MSHVRTVLGDISPEEMGLTYSHEHIIIEESFPTLANKEFLLNDVEKISIELKEFYSLGGRTVVDTMPANAGRNALKLAEVSKATGVHIIAPTGIHLEKYYPPNHWQFHLSENELSELFIRDIVDGIDENDYGCPVVKRTKHQAGLIKLATADETFSPHQEKIFRAVVNAHIQTGAPILTHTNYGRQAKAQAKLFRQLGADMNHVVLSHVDRTEDAEYHREILDMGVSLEYDSHFRWKNKNPNPTYELLKTLLPYYPEQLVVGMDMARNTYWKSYGGSPGLSYLLTSFKEQMLKMGLEEYLENIFYKNPQEIFSFTKA